MSNFNITLKPSQFEYVFKPGAVITQAYDITNNSQNPITLTSSVEAWAPEGFDGRVAYSPQYSSPNIEFSLANADIALGAPLTIPAGEKRQLVLKIKAAANAGSGDYYYTFFLNQISSDKSFSANSGASVSGKIGSHLLLSLSENENPENLLRIGNFFAAPKIKDSFLTPISFTAQIDNPGDYYNKIEGQIKISKSGREINTLKLEPLNVLAHYSRNASCLNNQNCTIKPPFWPGSYTASLTVNGKSETLTFYVFPFSLLPLLVLFGLLFWFIWKKAKTPGPKL